MNTGWYLALKTDGEAFPFYYNGNNISVPLEFKKDPNFKFSLNFETWEVKVTKPIIKEKIEWETSIWCQLTEILPLNQCITPNVERQMKYRKELVGKSINISNKLYQIMNIFHHIHKWTIYNIQNQDTQEMRSIQLHGTNWWSFDGKNKVDVSFS